MAESLFRELVQAWVLGLLGLSTVCWSGVLELCRHVLTAVWGSRPSWLMAVACCLAQPAPGERPVCSCTVGSYGVSYGRRTRCSSPTLFRVL